MICNFWTHLLSLLSFAQMKIQLLNMWKRFCKWQMAQKNYQYTFWEPKGYFVTLFAGQIDQIFSTHCHFLRFTPFLRGYLTSFFKKLNNKGWLSDDIKYFYCQPHSSKTDFWEIWPLWNRFWESKTVLFKVGFSFCGSRWFLATNSLFPQGTCTFFCFSDLVTPRTLASFDI